MPRFCRVRGTRVSSGRMPRFCRGRGTRVSRGRGTRIGRGRVTKSGRGRHTGVRGHAPLLTLARVQTWGEVGVLGGTATVTRRCRQAGRQAGRRAGRQAADC